MLIEEELMLTLRMIIAAACGAGIGFERSKRQKEAGIRTHIMVSMGAALIVIVSKFGYLDIVGKDGVSVDVSRMAANVVTGISFLGAGMIFLKGGVVKGLTTAAGIWATAGVGCAIGSGLYCVGISASVMIIIIQLILHICLKTPENMETVDISMKIKEEKGAFDKIKKLFAKNKSSILHFKIVYSDDHTQRLEFTIRKPQSQSIDDMFDEIKNICSIIEFSIGI